MDYKFLEFLGNYFINTAKYQKQAQEMQEWMNQGGSGFKEISLLFKKFYNVNGDTSSDEFFKAFKGFQKNYIELFSIPGMIPEQKYHKLKQKHHELEQKHHELKKKHDIQKDTIEYLSSMVTMKDTFQSNINQGIDHVMKNQKEIFENMINSLNPKK